MYESVRLFSIQKEKQNTLQKNVDVEITDRQTGVKEFRIGKKEIIELETK